MSFSGFKKQLNKANQILSEKVGGAKGTEYGAEFVALEKLIKSYEKMLEDLISKTQEYLQPNSGFRLLPSSAAAKETTTDNSNSTEGKVGQVLSKHGNELGQDTAMGPALLSTSEAFFELAEERRNLESNCRQNFLEPLQALQAKDLKQIQHHLKKLEGRRLDYDFKKRKGAKCVPEELQAAEAKYNESMQESQNAIVNFMECEGEHLQALLSFVKANKNFHTRARDIFEQLEKKLQRGSGDSRMAPYKKSSMVASRSSISGSSTTGGSGSPAVGLPRSTMSSNSVATTGMDPFAGSALSWDSPPQANVNFKKAHDNPTMVTPSCRVLFDFVAENDSELNLKEGEVVRLIEQVDDNWYFGESKGRQGHFPLSYVEVLIPLPASARP